MLKIDLLNNPFLSLIVALLGSLLILNIITSFFWVVLPPAGIQEVFNWGLSLVWSFNFFLDVPTLLFWFQTIFRLSLVFLSVKVVLFSLNIFAKLKK